MHGPAIIAEPVLQHADAIDHRIDTGQARQPVGFRVVTEIAGNPVKIGGQAARLGDIAAGRDDLMALAVQIGREM
jgi:hypothetical protein